MGLDHWLYKMRKCDPAVVQKADGMERSELEALFYAADAPEGFRHGFVALACEDTADMTAIADKVTLVDHEIDEDRLREDFNIPKAATYCGGRYGPSSFVQHYMLGGEKYEIDADPDEVAEKYDLPVKNEYWLCQAWELRQWRKRYDIQDAVYARHDIVNCGFHRVDDDETLDALEDLDDELMLPRLRDGEGIYYHEWY